MEIAVGSYKLILNLPYDSIGMLLFLVALTTVTYYYMRRLRKERTVKLGNFQTLKEVHGKKSIASPAILITKILMVVMLFLVATGSIQILSTQTISDTSFVVAIDNSQTMNIPDYPPNRLKFTKSTSKQWVSRLPEGTNISVLSFSGEVRPEVTGGTKREAEEAISSINLDLDSGGTAIGDAINLGSSILSETDNERKKIVLITDGNNTVGMNLSEAVSEAKKSNITVDIIGISSTDRTEQLYSNISSSLEEGGGQELQAPDINEESLENYAESTGGSFYAITSKNFFQTSLKDVITKEKTVELDSGFYVLIFISLLIILEMLLYSKFGAI